jgi:hypothetical protein
MSEVVKKTTNVIDGFEGYEDRFESDDERQQTAAGRVIQGAIIKFTNDAKWVAADGAELAPNRELIAVDITRLVQKWKDRLPVETIILEPGQRFPDVKKMNEETPQSEWEKGLDGQLRGPYQKQQILYLLDPVTLDRFCWPTSTVGGDKALRELVDKTKWMRTLCGGQVYPVITLSDTFMPTQYGGRQRPHFIVPRWVSLGSGKPALVAPPSETVAEPPKAEPLPGMQTVEHPSLSEQMGDEVPFNDSLDIDMTKATSPPGQPTTTTRKPAVTKAGVQKVSGHSR